MNCPKCNKPLEKMYVPGLMFCPKKQKAEKYGDPYNRKFRVVTSEDSGCGTLFQFPLNDYEYWNLIALQKYVDWNKVEKVEVNG